MDARIVQNRLLAVIVAILSMFALRATYDVTMPLAAAAVVIAAVWPVKPWLERFLPPSVSNVGAMLVPLAILAAFGAAISLAAAQVAQAFLSNADKFRRLYQSVAVWVEQSGGSIGGQAGYGRLVDIAERILANAYTVFVYLGFVAILVIFGLPEARALRRKIGAQFGGGQRHEVVEAVDATATKIRQYLLITTLTSVLTGAACFVWSFAVGLDLALVWGLLNFLLNYIPVIGNLIGIFPPALYAFAQFDSWTAPLVIFLGFAVIQIVVSNLVAPAMQGRTLSLSPMAVILALAAWSWIWGVAGALIAVPLTSTLIIICQHFPSVRWIATLLSEVGAAEEIAQQWDKNARPTAAE